MDGLVLPIILLLVSAAAFFAEVFLPSGGLLGIIGVSSAIGAIVFAFKVDSTTGAIFVGVAIVLIPVTFGVALTLLPRTRIGRRLMLTKEQTKEEGYVSQNLAEEALLGHVGEALSNLRPAGIARIEGKRYDVVTEGEMVDRGTPIEVRRVEGNRIVVRALQRM